MFFNPFLKVIYFRSNFGRTRTVGPVGITNRVAETGTPHQCRPLLSRPFFPAYLVTRTAFLAPQWRLTVLSCQSVIHQNAPPPASRRCTFQCIRLSPQNRVPSILFPAGPRGGRRRKRFLLQIRADLSYTLSLHPMMSSCLCFELTHFYWDISVGGTRTFYYWLFTSP